MTSITFLKMEEINVRNRVLYIVFTVWFIAISIFIYPTRTDAIIPVVAAPALEYAIVGTLSAAGLYAANKDSVDAVVSDYYSQLSEYEKKQWAMISAAGISVGRIVIDNSLVDSVVNYLNSKYKAGNNTVNGEEHISNVVKNVQYQGTTVYINGLPMSIVNITYHGNAPAVAEFDIVYNGQIVSHYDSNLQSWISSVEIQDIQFKWDGADIITWLWKEKFSNGTNESRYKPVSISGTQTVTNKTYDKNNYTGDSAGFGSALPSGNLSIPVPAAPEVEWPDTWLDDLEKELNEADNPSIDDETLIEEWDDEFDWYVDSETGELYKVPKGSPPRRQGDRLISPVPIDPDEIPDVGNYPDVNNPDVTETTGPSDIEKILNPDGTTTTTTTQRKEKTERWYDPDKQKWIERKTTTTTKREVITNPDGSIVSDNTTTETTDPTITEQTPPGDDSGIDWGPLKRGLYEATNKFPFSLPWDLYRSIKQLNSSTWDGKFKIDIDSKLPPGGFHFDIDLSMFEGLIEIAKKVELFLFDISLILITRKLMGGDV